jgi:hypothetical protein
LGGNLGELEGLQELHHAFFLAETAAPGEGHRLFGVASVLFLEHVFQ